MKEKVKPTPFKPHLYCKGRANNNRVENIVNRGGTAYIYLEESDSVTYDRVVKVYFNKNGNLVVYFKNRRGGQILLDDMSGDMYREALWYGIPITEDEYYAF